MSSEREAELLARFAQDSQWRRTRWDDGLAHEPDPRRDPGNVRRRLTGCREGSAVPIREQLNGVDGRAGPLLRHQVDQFARIGCLAQVRIRVASGPSAPQSICGKNPTRGKTPQEGWVPVCSPGQTSQIGGVGVAEVFSWLWFMRSHSRTPSFDREWSRGFQVVIISRDPESTRSLSMTGARG